MGRKKLPDYLPILNDKMAKGDYKPYYQEREITEPVMLCDDNGDLNPDAVGWSRKVLTTANMRGHWGRKKRWHFWNVICHDFVISVTLAHLDYMVFCAIMFEDFKDKRSYIAVAPKTGLGRVDMPEDVEGSVEYNSLMVKLSMENLGDSIKVKVSCRDPLLRSLSAEFTIPRPESHDTLNFVTPWAKDRFQMNTKINSLPTEGFVEVFGKKYIMDPEKCHAVMDLGRGIWPYRACWNWGVATGVVDGDLVGVNMGDRWTVGTGASENGIWVNGRLTKVMEDLKWDGDRIDWMKPWHVYSQHSDAIDMTMTPFLEKAHSLNLGFTGTGGAQVFGTWDGVVRPEGREVKIKNLVGWLEEFWFKW